MAAQKLPSYVAGFGKGRTPSCLSLGMVFITLTCTLTAHFIHCTFPAVFGMANIQDTLSNFKHGIQDNLLKS